MSWRKVKKLKQQPGRDILVYGSGKLVNTLLQHDLVDELRLMVHPVVLGSGRRLFDDNPETMKGLKLADSKTFPSGIVLLTRHPAKYRTLEGHCPRPSNPNVNRKIGAGKLIHNTNAK